MSTPLRGGSGGSAWIHNRFTADFLRVSSSPSSSSSGPGAGSPLGKSEPARETFTPNLPGGPNPL